MAFSIQRSGTALGFGAAAGVASGLLAPQMGQVTPNAGTTVLGIGGLATGLVAPAFLPADVNDGLTTAGAAIVGRGTISLGLLLADVVLIVGAIALASTLYQNPNA